MQFFIIADTKRQFSSFVIENNLENYIHGSKELRYLSADSFEYGVKCFRDFYIYDLVGLSEFNKNVIRYRRGGIILEKSEFIKKLTQLPYVLKKDNMYFAIATIDHMGEKENTIKGFWTSVDDRLQVYHMRTVEEAKNVAKMFELKDYKIVEE